jgi:penicillin-binding protein 1C
MAIALSLAIGAAALAVVTQRALRDFPAGLVVVEQGSVKPVILARDGTRLNLTLQNAWNSGDQLPLNRIPPLLVRAFIVSEDQRFADNHGADWRARLAALGQDLRAGAAVRGASTISEQVVRMLHPRPRTLWSRWLEGFEAGRLEARCSKEAILEFYLNQVPYGERRRGVAQAARLYFNRSLDTLSPGELLALVVLVRSPSGMDLRRDPARALDAIDRLAARLQQEGTLTATQESDIRQAPPQPAAPGTGLEAGYFVNVVLDGARAADGHAPREIRTTLDPHFQSRTEEILGSALTQLARRRVRDGGVLIIDNERNEVLAWVVGHNAAPGDPPVGAGRGFDTILTPRQPGSTMKPLLYAMALERGWTAATIIDDSELLEAVGAGVHTFHNYSHEHYGPIRLREALGNSLNIPAVKTLKFVGREAFMGRLHDLGIQSLTQHPDFYGDGLALGNGEVTLYEMAQAYTALARHGRLLPLAVRLDQGLAQPEHAVYAPEIARLIGDILADPDARRLEFGAGLQFPVETAIKTGTSTDYRDAWAIAYNYRYTVAAWMGNLDGSAMNGVTGSTGPAMVLRSVFSELNRNQETRDLGSKQGLVAARICRRDGLPATPGCEAVTEWFLPGTVPSAVAKIAHAPVAEIRLVLPTPGLQVAIDPRIPDEFEALPMEVTPAAGLSAVDWYVDGQLATTTAGPRYDWPLAKGTHEVYTRVHLGVGAEPRATETVRFYVH